MRKPVPYDLTAVSDIRLVARKKLPLTATLKLTDKKGKNHEVHFPLTEDQAEHYDKIDSWLKHEYLKVLAEEHDEIVAYLKKMQKNSS